MRADSRTAGFTLLEVLVAVFVLSIVMISVMRLYAQSIDMNAAFRFYVQAPYLAQLKISEAWEDPESFLGSSSGDFQDLKIDGYEWERTVETIPVSVAQESQTTELYKISVLIKNRMSGAEYQVESFLRQSGENSL